MSALFWNGLSDNKVPVKKMTCCAPTIVPFTNAPSVSIVYSPLMQEQYGSRPNVQVYIKEGEEFVVSDFNAVVFDGASIEVDNGGPNTGFVKIF